jgi:hypothetical protein
MGFNSAFKGLKQRSQSHSIKIGGEAAGADIGAIRAFTAEFKKIIGGNDFPPDIKMTWEEVTVSCMKGVWHKIWPSNENFGTNCDNLDMSMKEISEIAEVGLGNVVHVGNTEVLEKSLTTNVQ